MKARFDDQMKISAAGRKLQACGPLDWNDPGGPQNANKITVTVTITQGGVTATKTSGEFARPTAEWMVDLRPGPGQKFGVGPAQATGTLTVTEMATGASAGPPFNWNGDTDLESDPDDS